MGQNVKTYWDKMFVTKLNIGQNVMSCKRFLGQNFWRLIIIIWVRIFESIGMYVYPDALLWTTGQCPRSAQVL